MFLRLSERENTVSSRAEAEQAGVSVQRLLVDAATVPERTTAERHALYTTLLATQRAVLGAANNLNQVARGVNSTGASTGGVGGDRGGRPGRPGRAGAGAGGAAGGRRAVIAKITRGADGAGLVRYLMGEGRAEEHTDQRVIAAADMVVVPIGDGLVARGGRRAWPPARRGPYAVRDRGRRRPRLAPGPVEPGGGPAALRRRMGGRGPDAMSRLGFTRGLGEGAVPVGSGAPRALDRRP